MTDLSHGTAPVVAAPLPPDTSPVLRALLHALPPVAESQRLADALQIFARHEAASAIAVLSAGRPTGLICRRMIADVVMLPCYRESIRRELCACFVSVAPLTVAHDAELPELASLLASRPAHEPHDPLVVTYGDRYVGVVERQALARRVARLWHPAPREGRERAADPGHCPCGWLARALGVAPVQGGCQHPDRDPAWRKPFS